MKFKIYLSAFVLLCQYSLAQPVSFKWWNPESSAFPVLEGQAWPKELNNFYDRLPARAEGVVTDAVWKLSKQPAGLMLRFRSDAGEIKVRYLVADKHGLPHMPATGVSGVDLYAVSSDGDQRWSSGKYVFGDTIVYTFKNIEPNDQYHKMGREYRLFLPLYNQVKWLEIGVADSSKFSPLPARPDKPIVIYGTSIAQGGCASRPGMAWTSILGRKMDDPLINLGFSGNGRLDKEVIDVLSEIDAKIFVLDCLPNLTIWNDPRNFITGEEIKRRLIYAVNTLKSKHPGVPVVLAEHAGYTDEAINPVWRKYSDQVNVVLRQTFDELKKSGVNGLYIIPKQDFGQDIETMVDGTHPSDLGMMRYALGYEKHLREILSEPAGTTSTTKAVTQLREPNNYDWEMRHREILSLNKTDPPKTIVIGNSITHFWAGVPAGPRVTDAASWNSAFGTSVHNLGYGWDRIENVLWRLYHGELDGYKATQIFVNIGTNNVDMNSDAEIIAGWEVLINAIKIRQPASELIMMGIYPRRQKEERVRKLNEQLAALTKKLSVKYIDPGKVFVQKSGVIDESLFSDGLHPNAKGYTLLGAAIKPFLKN